MAGNYVFLYSIWVGTSRSPGLVEDTLIMHWKTNLGKLCDKVRLKLL